MRGRGDSRACVAASSPLCAVRSHFHVSKTSTLLNAHSSQGCQQVSPPEKSGFLRRGGVRGRAACRAAAAFLGNHVLRLCCLHRKSVGTDHLQLLIDADHRCKRCAAVALLPNAMVARLLPRLSLWQFVLVIVAVWVSQTSQVLINARPQFRQVEAVCLWCFHGFARACPAVERSTFLSVFSRALSQLI